MVASDEARQKARWIAQAASEVKAEQIIAFDVSDRFAISDVFVVASAANERQVSAVVDKIEDELIERGVKPVNREGRSSGRWVLVDYGDVVVHVLHDDERAFYGLERLWKDCPVIDVAS